ncbi:MAG: exosome complex RNA-binding protein Rrp4 [Euryarchaeota archaeon]|nr:exosome complex RNA-binding protein Rrp4 [Euryarchaeota archaeon]
MAVFVENRSLVIPGDLIAEGNFKASDGTFQEQDRIYASVLGLVDVGPNKTIRVIPFAGKYMPKINDVVIGKVVDLRFITWIIDINAPYLADLHANEVLDRKVDLTEIDLLRFYDVGDLLISKVIDIDEEKNIRLTTKAPGLGKLHGGRLVKISPVKVPRIIGRSGSMIKLIKDETKCEILASSNGRVWIKGKDSNLENLAIQAILKIEQEAHTTGLTDRIKEMLQKERGEKIG